MSLQTILILYFKSKTINHTLNFHHMFILSFSLQETVFKIFLIYLSYLQQWKIFN